MAGDSSQRGEVVVEMDPLLNTMEQKLRILESKSFEREESCTIYRVLPSIHGDDGAAYDPKIISICPYHWNNNQLSSTEEIKWQFLLSLINQNKENKLSKWLRLIRAQEPRARKLYSEKLELEHDAFVEMLVLDGCFIIELLVKLTLPTKNEQIFDENWKLPLIRSDILMLENQIPFFILQALFDSTVIPEFVFEDKNEAPVTLVELALSYVTHGRMEVLPQSAKNVDILHLLHLFHMSLAPNPVQKESKPFSWIRLLLPSVHYHKNKRAPRTIPSVTELQEAGIMFKKREAKCYLDVKFGEGAMEIPQLSIQATTISEFRNLIAFEQCCPGSGSHFTSYAAFMDNLINTQMDVAVLQDCGIIESKLGSYKDVAFFFNQLCKGGYLDYEKHYLAKVFKDVREYCESERHR
ncbi:hypothetical protein J5N97_015403 [Dioscorea zingiberensis]|uniref:Uncharacterized protein n=1 Tax=Dioscorea zingiberensis TaxID=325984 RepID=A0A9D5CVN0_9LILI|nr:hypothetical protein J5N97_015403 [Dioscorea zingiberensis]